MPKSPQGISPADLLEMWPRLMPPLRDQGEADLVNRLLGNILADLRERGFETQGQVFVADASPSPERQQVIDSGAVMPAEFFALIYSRWDRSPQFRKFWSSMTDEERQNFWKVVVT